jgi:tetratricopeptide (TPR) repeat protein
MESRFDDAIAYSTKWLDDQPFSPDPAIFSTYISAVVKDDGAEIVKIGSRAAKSNPENFTVLNNLAVGYAFQGVVEQAERLLKRARGCILDEKHRAIYEASVGLLAYRSGKIAEARGQYEKAIRYFSGVGCDPKAVSIAKLFMLREELRKNNSADPYVRKIYDSLAIDYKTSPELENLCSKIRQAMESAKK